jgi:hypothetical protein
MRHASVAVVILLLATATHAQTLAQPSVSHDCGNATSCSASLANPITLGNYLLFVVRLGTTNVSATKVSDNVGSAYALDASVIQSIDGHTLAVYRAQIGASGTPTVTVTNSSASTARIIGLEEVTGLISGAPDGVNKAIGSSSLPNAGLLSPTQSNDYILLAVSTADNEAFTASGSFHREQDLTRGAYADEYQATAAGVSGSMSLSSADQWAAIAVAYKTTPRLPILFQLNYSDGTAVQGSVQLAVLSSTTSTTLASWPINSTGAVAGYLPLVNTGTYSYTVFDLTSKQIQTISVLPGAFAALAGLHSIQGAITINKTTDAMMIPGSLLLQ